MDKRTVISSLLGAAMLLTPTLRVHAESNRIPISVSSPEPVKPPVTPNNTGSYELAGFDPLQVSELKDIYEFSPRHKELRESVYQASTNRQKQAILDKYFIDNSPALEFVREAEVYLKNNFENNRSQLEELTGLPLENQPYSYITDGNILTAISVDPNTGMETILFSVHYNENSDDKNMRVGSSSGIKDFTTAQWLQNYFGAVLVMSDLENAGKELDVTQRKVFGDGPSLEYLAFSPYANEGEPVLNILDEDAYRAIVQNAYGQLGISQ